MLERRDVSNRNRNRKFGFAAVVVLLLGGLMVPAAAALDPTALLDRALALSSGWRDDATFVSIDDISRANFTASDGPHEGETVESVATTVTDSEGAYHVVVLLYDQPWISTFRGDATGTFVGGSWELASLDPHSAVVQGGEQTRVVAANELACAVGVGVVGGAGGTAACLPLTPIGQIICGALGGAGGTVVGYFVCQDPAGEGLFVDLTCFEVDRCQVDITVRSFGRRALSINADTYWDLKGQANFVLGAIPCRPACGDHSITLHSNSGRQFVKATELPDPDNLPNTRTLYEYTFAFTMVGQPTCFVKNTVGVWSFFTANLENTTRKLYADSGAKKNTVYCPY